MGTNYLFDLLTSDEVERERNEVKRERDEVETSILNFIQSKTYSPKFADKLLSLLTNNMSITHSPK